MFASQASSMMSSTSMDTTIRCDEGSEFERWLYSRGDETTVKLVTAFLALHEYPARSPALTDTQLRVLNYIHGKSVTLSNTAKRLMASYAASYGITSDTIDDIEYYMRMKVPITIRFDPARTIPHLINDPLYRNCFEVGCRSSSYLRSRRQWEADLFGGIYESPYQSLDKQRPKYAVLNLVCNANSDTRLQSFGEAYFILKDDVRFRCTISTSKEYSTSRRFVGNLANCWHVLQTLSTHQLSRLAAVASKFRNMATITTVDLNYLETHIHGDVNCKTDIRAVAVPPSYSFSKNEIDRFCKKYDIPIITTTELAMGLEEHTWSVVVRDKENAR